MPVAFPRNRIRLEVDTKTGTIKDVLISASPSIWISSSLDVEFGIFRDGTVVDITGMSSISVSIMVQTRHGLSAVVGTVALADMNSGLTKDQWTSGTSQHGTVTFTAADLNIDLGSNKTGTFWLKVVGAELVDGDPVMMGGVDIVLKESGINLDSNLPAQGANLVPSGAIYDVGGAYVLAVTVDRVHSWLKGANDTSVVNGTETLTTSGNFTAQGGSVTLHGTIGMPVTAFVRYPLFVTYDDLKARTANTAQSSNPAGFTFSLRSPDGRFVRTLQVDNNGDISWPLTDTDNTEPS